jgi:outer membrane protein TolC
MVVLLTFIFSLSSAVFASADLDQLLQKAIQDLPNQTLSLDFVTFRAMKSSDSYKAILADKDRTNALKSLSQTPYETFLYSKIADINNKNEPITPFAPFRQNTRSYSVGAKKYFQTGTTLNGEINRSHSIMKFGGTSPFSLDFYQSIGSLSLTQNLWKDSFGYATRKGEAASEFNAKVNELSVQEAKQNWFFDLTKLYYMAWYLQFKVKEASESVQRREKLFEITKIKLNRGTAEKSDLIQVESSLEQSQMSFQSNKQQLEDIWRNLVIALGFPDYYMGIDPMKIPTQLDQPEEKANLLCKNFLNEQNINSVNLAKLQNILKQTEVELEKAENLKKPDANLTFQAASNGIDSRSTQTYSDVRDFSYPAYSIGVNLTIPLNFYAEEASISQARSNKMKTSYLFAQATAQEKVNWVNTCLDFNRVNKNIVMLKNIVENQSLRSRLDKERYQLGRVGLINVIQTFDDLTSAQLQLKESQMTSKLLAWKIQLLTEDVKNILNDFETGKNLVK